MAALRPRCAGPLILPDQSETQRGVSASPYQRAWAGTLVGQYPFRGIEPAIASPLQGGDATPERQQVAVGVQE